MEDEFDFTKPHAPFNPDSTIGRVVSAPFKPTVSRFYDVRVATQLFKNSGKKEHFPAGETLFLENEKSGKHGLFGKRTVHRMNLITEGEVALFSHDKLLDTIKANDIFGEMAVISDSPAGSTRSAMAKVKTECSALSLDAAELQDALSHTPKFALMLMSVMFERLRFLAARLALRDVAKSNINSRSEPVFDAPTLAALERKLEHATVVRFTEGQQIMEAGQPGTTMYIVLEGRVTIAINNKIVEKLDVGGVFGEMALVDQSPRTANALARTDCALLSMNRHALIDLVKSDPAIGMAMMRCVANRMRYMNSLFA